VSLIGFGARRLAAVGTLGACVSTPRWYRYPRKMMDACFGVDHAASGGRPVADNNALADSAMQELAKELEAFNKTRVP